MERKSANAVSGKTSLFCSQNPDLKEHLSKGTSLASSGPCGLRAASRSEAGCPGWFEGTMGSPTWGHIPCKKQSTSRVVGDMFVNVNSSVLASQMRFSSSEMLRMSLFGWNRALGATCSLWRDFRHAKASQGKRLQRTIERLRSAPEHAIQLKPVNLFLDNLLLHMREKKQKREERGERRGEERRGEERRGEERRERERERAKGAHFPSAVVQAQGE